MLEKLQTFPAQRTLLIGTLVGLIAFVILNIVMYLYTAATAAVGAPSIIDFELTWGAARAQDINTLYWLLGVHDEQFTLNLIDFAYMPTYAFFIGGAVLLTARGLPKGRQQQFGYAAALMPFGAWVCDVVENANLLQILLGYIDEATALTASIMATIKFAFLFIAIGAFVGHLLRLLVLRMKRRSPQVEKNVPVTPK